MLIAHITSPDPAQGFVINVDDMTIAIHCQRIEQGEWEPLFGIKRGIGRIQLPTCFVLDRPCMAVLEMAYEDYMEENYWPNRELGYRHTSDEKKDDTSD